MKIIETHVLEDERRASLLEFFAAPSRRVEPLKAMFPKPVDLSAWHVQIASHGAPMTMWPKPKLGHWPDSCCVYCGPLAECYSTVPMVGGLDEIKDDDVE